MPPEWRPNLVSTIPRSGAPVIVQYRSAREAAQEMLKLHLGPRAEGTQSTRSAPSDTPRHSQAGRTYGGVCVSDARTLHGASGGPRVEIRRLLVFGILTERAEGHDRLTGKPSRIEWHKVPE